MSVGFKPKSDEKAAIGAIAEALSTDQSLAQALHEVRQLPEPTYRDDEWAVLDALIQVLVRSAVALQVTAAAEGVTDYAGLADAALTGLGNEAEGYTDLGLYLDSRIRHLLIDEFQDTNQTQLQLLGQLTAGWTNGDGRTLFVVGDPMQSIYRFREAEVGLFLTVRDHGINDLVLNDQRLQANFRSRDEIVQWLNKRLQPIFPRFENTASGAVAYTEAMPYRGQGGSVHTYAHRTSEAEAAALVEQLQEALDAHRGNPEFSAAIIVAARSHLQALLPALAEAQIPYRAVKLERLTDRSVIQDLLALTQATLNPNDRTAWLALLRSPLCGLSLEQLLALAPNDNLLDPQSLAPIKGSSAYDRAVPCRSP